MKTTRSMQRTFITVLVVLTMCGSVSSGWSIPVPVSEVNTQYNEADPFSSFDGLSLYFARGNTSSYYHFRIFEATRQEPSGPFTSVKEILSSGNQHVFAPWVSPDNLRMYYFAQKESPILWQLKVSERASVNDSWPQGSDISELNQLGKVYKPGLTADELTIVFTSYDIAGGQGGYDIWMATRPDTNSPFDNVTNLSEINTASNDANPYISPDGMTLYFHSDRNGSAQLFRTTRGSLSDPFGNLEHLSFFDTPGGSSVSPTLSSDGTTLYFGRALTGQPSDIYVSYSGPVAHWKFDEGAGGVAYDSAGTNDGTIYGAQWTAGIIDGALDFDGVDDYVNIPYNASLDIDASEGITLSTWIKLHSYPAGDDQGPIFGLFDSMGAGTKNYSVIRGSAGGNVIAWEQYPPSGGAITSIKPDLETWYHVVVTEDSPHRAIYINGSLDSSDSLSVSYSGNTPDTIRIGNRADAAIFSFDGLIDDVRIYDRALSALEIMELYAPPSPPGPVAHWKFDEGSGAVAYDSAGGNDGTIYGAQWTTGQINDALSFDGVDDYVDIPYHSSLDRDASEGISLSVWFNLNSYPTGFDQGPVFGLFDSAAESAKNYLYIDKPLYGNLISWIQWPSPSGAIASIKPDLNTWYHVVAVEDSPHRAIYIDGSLDSSDNLSQSYTGNTPDTIRIGNRADSIPFYFDGSIDDVRIYDRALSAGEVEQLYGFGGENLLVNGGFETMEILSGGWPTEYGDWSGDHCYIFGRYGDVWPFQGSRLMQFSGTSSFGCGGGAESQVYQIVDVNAFSDAITDERATASASVYFNRLPGDAETDTEFSLNVRAFAGDPGSFPSLQGMGGMHLAEASASIFTDGDPATWQQCQVQLALPADTDYVVVGISAIENIYNDPCWPEFDGHCADAASLIMVVDPNVTRDIYHVDGVNGSDLNDGLTKETAFATIQKGINSSDDGDTVLVWPGVYNEAATQGINFKGKAITVKSAADAAVLEVPGFIAVTFAQGEDGNSVFSNFVVRGSDTGILALFANPTISNVTIVDNDNGIIADNADPEITNCIFWNNFNGDLFGSPDPIEAGYSWFEDDVNEPNMPAAGLISHWKFDEGGGLIAYDSAGNNDGVVFGAAWTTSPFGNALYFDGVDDYVEVNSADELKLNLTGSISVWVLPNDLYRHSIVNKHGAPWSGNKTVNYWLVFGSYNQCSFVIGDGASYVQAMIPLEGFAVGKWNNIVGTWNSSNIKIYGNGELKDTQANTLSDLVTSDDYPVRIGSDNGDGWFFDGLIDEVAIYNRALSAEEVEQIYEPVPKPLFADAAGGDYHLKSGRGRYWPAHDVWVLDDETSPCIDGGDPGIGPTNEPMPNGGRINMGAYGNTAYASMSECRGKADINCDGIVNFKDLAIVAQFWLEE
ncbi:MAG: hypothetical protein GWN67_16725 [Phycisphaerae bacterium]|nr:hypothetical protein [Phycisphaerae bacterium]NIP53852.1 hypothetical protein [Phycisphaerae bacterium]NIS52801.1 hypothetical protein [Phycisphaerae bacterium]NIU10213.1 hypothetical protein [Phycisphaerae bacterium]NIU57971.1 hypothetical protein [Phycisphaerae bacterium]